MFRSNVLLKRAERRGGKAACETLKKKPHFIRIEAKEMLTIYWGRPLKTWPYFRDHLDEKSSRLSTPELKLKRYSVTDPAALLERFITDLMAHLLPASGLFETGRSLGLSRFRLALRYFKEGNTFTQRFIMPPVLILFEPLLLPFCLLLLLGAAVCRLLVPLGFRFPALWLFNFTLSRSGLHGKEVLPPGENGYTRLFRGGEHVEIDDLETELMERHAEHSTPAPQHGSTIIALSYKHFANKGRVPGDDHRICRTDLLAIAQLIKDAAPCNLRFWIDAKLPPTSDDSFERWIRRGVRPYGRYITFICPSALEFAESSFWLANEYRIATAAKGVMFLENDQIIFELRNGYPFHLHRRFLQVLIGVQDSLVHVREQDKGKVIHWAMCYLNTPLHSSFRGLLSPPVDNMTMFRDSDNECPLFNNIAYLISELGPQELPVGSGRSWNKNNPLLMGDALHIEFDLSNWYGFCLDGCPTTIFFVYSRILVDVLRLEKVLVLEVTLDSPHFNPGKIQVRRKVLRELESSILLNCKFVTLPWACEWE